jgi:hypothetical protein
LTAPPEHRSREREPGGQEGDVVQGSSVAVRIVKVMSIVAVAMGCASALSADGPIDRTSTARTDYFQVVVPHGQGWELVVDAGEGTVSCIGNVQPGVGAEIQLMRNWVRGSGLLVGARAVADDFRSKEVVIMNLQGVAPGIYELENVVKGEVELGEKIFYSMTFTQRFRREGLAIDGSLYLFFPENFLASRKFFSVLFKDVYSTASPARALSPQDLEQVLRSFEVLPN